jgi:hypothetical protein
MKRIFILVAVVVISVGNVFADRNVLIDFSNLVGDLDNGENRQTLMDFSQTARGNSFTQEQRDQLKTSLLLQNWLVTLASSSQSVTNNALSKVQQATSKGFFDGEVPVMGVRVHFPVEPYNSWALVRPPFEIPAYDYSEVGEDGLITTPAPEEQVFANPTRFENGYGVLKNVGAIKSIAVRVYGLNFPHHLSIVYENDLGEQKTIPMGYLNFDGWVQLTWENPAYIQDIRARAMRLYPLYPANSSYIKFVGFLVKRDAASAGGDFVGYFRDVEVIYDKAILDAEAADIDDEATWNIRKEREAAKTDRDGKDFSVERIFRYIEEQKQATENFSNGATADNANANNENE